MATKVGEEMVVSRMLLITFCVLVGLPFKNSIDPKPSACNGSLRESEGQRNLI